MCRPDTYYLTPIICTQTLPIGDLGERKTEKLIETGKGLDLVIAAVAGNTPAEGVQGHKVHDLRKNQLADIHGCSPPGGSQEDARPAATISSR